jgi:transcriptional regulator with XRE-family HTH domain
MSVAPPLQNHLRALREARGLTLEQLASAVGTTNQQISLLELGKRQLTVAWLKRLAAALDCHPWAIVEGSSSDPTPGERDLIERFHKLGSHERTTLLRTLERLEANPTAPPSAKSN